MTYLTISEAANRLNVSSETLRRWDKSGKFKSQRHPINNYRVYPENQVLLFANDLDLNYGIQKNIPISKIEPYFTSDYGKLYNGDSLEILKSFDSASIDVVFADPPYNIKKAQWDSFNSQKEYVDWSLKWIEEASRIIKHDGSVFICGFSEILADLKWASSHLFKGCKWLVWFYRNKANLGSDWGRSHESILHLRKSKEFKFNIDEVRIPYNQHTIKYPTRKQAESSQYAKNRKTKKEYIWQPHPLGAKPKDVLEIPTISNGSWERFTHETQKPVELLKRIILASSNKGEIVLDPFGGSGTTFAVSEAFGRNWIGIEREVEYCNVIRNRISDKSHISRIRSSKDEIESHNRRSKLRG